MKFTFTLPSRKSLEFCMSHGRKYLLLCAHLCCILEKLLQYTHLTKSSIYNITHLLLTL